MRERRKRNFFTQEQIKQFRLNPYTYSVTDSNIRFTAEFKKMFWQQYQEGKIVRDIFVDAGYDVEALGDGRIYNFSHNLTIAVKAGRDFSEGYSKRPNPDSTKLSALEHEVLYLRQQVDFLKKISALETSKKSEN